MENQDRNIPAVLISMTLAATYSLFTLPVVVAGTVEDETAGEPVTVTIGADGIQRLEIILDSYTFTPDYIIVQSGKPVEFTLKNIASLAPHNFRIDAQEDNLLFDEDVKAGKSATVIFIPDKPGVYEFYCDKKLPFSASHREKGMIGKLEVQ